MFFEATSKRARVTHIFKQLHMFFESHFYDSELIFIIISAHSDIINFHVTKLTSNFIINCVI
jgi:hypothetical protein